MSVIVIALVQKIEGEIMDTPDHLKTQLTQSQPIPFAATIWEDQPDLFEQLRRRLASFAPNTQRALASDWKVWRLWCLKNARIEFPASPTDISEFALAHSPPLYTDQTGCGFLLILSSLSLINVVDAVLTTCYAR